MFTIYSEWDFEKQPKLNSNVKPKPKRNCQLETLVQSVHLGINPHFQKHHPSSFSVSSPLKLNLQIAQACFLGNSLLYIGFLWSPRKYQIFQWTPIIILKLFVINPIPSFKSITKFLVKVSQVLTEKIFVYKLFWH